MKICLLQFLLTRGASFASGAQPVLRANAIVCLMVFAGLVPHAVFAAGITTQPQSQSVVAGSNAVFTVVASGQAPISYQWSFNGANLTNSTHIAGATKATLTVSNVVGSDAGNYRVVVTNSHSGVTSSNAVLTVLFPPSLTSQPTNQTVYVGDAVVFSVTATGTMPLGYQWRFNGTNLTGQTNPVLSITATTNQTGNYSAVVTNICGSIQSSNATLSVLDSAPVILTQPANQFPNAASDARLQVIATGSKPLSYQWWFNGGILPGATNSALQLSGVSPAQNGSYQVVVSNRLGMSNSTSAILTVQTVVAWGDNRAGACSPPEELLTNVVAIAGEYYAGVALRADGQWIQWVGGYIFFPWSGLVALSSGSQHTLGVTTNGGIVAWGSNNYGESYPPPVSSNVVAVAGGSNHSLALMSDGTVVAWGDDSLGQTNIPAGLSNVTAIASGDSHNLALRVNGTVVGWGANSSGQINIPPGLSNVTAVSCGVSHSLALKSDGTVTAWGDNSEGQTNVPAGLTNVVSIACGYNHCLVLKADGTVAAWGGDEYGAIEVPAGLTNVMAISAGLAYRCMTIVGKGSPVVVQPPAGGTVVVGQSFLFDSSAIGTVPLRYQWQFNGTNLFNSASPTLLLTNIGLAQAGTYSVAVSNTLGGVASADAILTVLPLEITSQPASASVVQGTNFSFSVSTISTQPVSYQWLFNEQNLPDATNSVLTLNNVQTNSDGDYVVVAANSFGAVTSAVAALTVIVPPTFTNQPIGQSVLAGQSVSFNGAADSMVPQTYQWFFNGIQMADTPRISDSATSSLSISNVQASDAGNYTLVAANVAGSATSAVAVLNVLLPPAITQSPQSQNVLAGSNFSLTVSATGNPSPAYQWSFNGTPLTDGGRITGSSSNALTVALSQTNDSGNYWVTASNSFGMATSTVAAVSVQLPVTITGQPANQVVMAGSNATFTVAATGFVPPGYFWYSNGTPLANGGRISGATSATLTIAGTQTNDSAAYQVMVTNIYGSATSSVATLTVYAAVQITGQPSSQAVLLGGNAAFTVTVAGSALSYQWFFNGAPLSDGGRISGSATPVLNIANVQSSDAGGYIAVVTNPLSAAASRTASLTPQFILAPSVRYVALTCTNPLPPYLDWSTAATNIQDAVDAAVVGDLVLASNGVYSVGGRAVYGQATNRVTIDRAITVQSVNGPLSTFIRGDYTAPTHGGPNTRCAYLTNGATLSGFTLTNGGTAFSTNLYLEASGGALWCESSGAVVSNCILVHSVAARFGGGAFQGTLINCLLTNNFASQGGGACSNVLLNCTLTRNSASFQNLNTGGGAIYSMLSNCLLVANSCVGGGGGAAISTLSSCVLSNNTANYGGGVCVGVVNNSLISSNRASVYGGGAFSNFLNNCVVRNNLARNAGGGAYNSVLLGCTVVSNSVADGGGIWGGAATNCIIYYNAGDNIENSKLLAYNCSFPLGSVTNPPLFMNLAGADYHLQSSSPCINAGCNAAAAVSNDFDGNPRIVGGTVDIGAYEYQTPTSIISYAWLQQYGFPTDGSADYADTDGDGMNNWQEWRTGTDPTNPLSVLTMLNPTPTNNPWGLVVSWQSVNGITYFLQSSTNLGAQPAFSTIQSNIVGQTGTTSYTDTNAIGSSPFFYRIGVQQ